MKKLIIIDGNSLLFRAFYATYNPNAPIMRAKDGTPTNAIFAFSNMLSRIISSFKKDEHLLVVFDTGKKTFRHQELDSYKANRKPLEPDFKIQMPIARDLLVAMGVYTYELEGYEGDDIAGSAAKKAQSLGYDVSIYTSDKDFLQLIDKHIRIHLIKRGLSDIKIMDEDALMQEYGLTPSKIPDFKGLMGDPSDNLKGIPGVGQKTAIKLIQQYGDLETIIQKSYENKGKIYESIIENQDSGRLCKHLAQIKTDLELPFTIENTAYQGFRFDKLADFCHRYDLKSLLNKIDTKFSLASKNEEKLTYQKVKNLPHFKDKIIGLALNFDENDYYNYPIMGIAIALTDITYYLEIKDALNDAYLLEILKDTSIKKCCYDFKAMKVALSRVNIELGKNYFDMLIAAYIIDSSLNNNIDAIFNYFSISLTKKEEEISLFNDDEQLITRVCEMAFYLLHHAEIIENQLKDNDLFDLYNVIELPLADVLAKMEIEGFPLDVKKLDAIGEDFLSKQQEAERKILEIVDHPFNISSPKQVGEVLTELGVFEEDKRISTSVEVLKKVSHRHSIVPLILEYRKYAKLTSTYIDGLKNHIHEDGKLHPNFNQALTTTGRLSSSNPNLQNISVRDEEGKLIRKAFYYQDDDTYILSFDYSQVELRVLAALSNCEGLLRAFNNDEDIHEATARNVFHHQEITTNDRRKAKAVNFGIVYGISDWGLAEQLEISTSEAKNIIKSFYETYPEIREFMSRIIANAEKDGYVKTIFGRIRYLREMHDSNYQVHEFAKRAATNAPIQGTAADLIKIAMINIDKMLSDNHLETKLVLQIHDELIFKAPKKELNIVYDRIKDLMENVFPSLGVKLKVDGNYAKSWYDAK